MFVTRVALAWEVILCIHKISFVFLWQIIVICDFQWKSCKMFDLRIHHIYFFLNFHRLPDIYCNKTSNKRPCSCSLNHIFFEACEYVCTIILVWLCTNITECICNQQPKWNPSNWVSSECWTLIQCATLNVIPHVTYEHTHDVHYSVCQQPNVRKVNGWFAINII